MDCRRRLFHRQLLRCLLIRDERGVFYFFLSFLFDLHSECFYCIVYILLFTSNFILHTFIIFSFFACFPLLHIRLCINHRHFLILSSSASYQFKSIRNIPVFYLFHFYIPTTPIERPFSLWPPTYKHEIIDDISCNYIESTCDTRAVTICETT